MAPWMCMVANWLSGRQDPEAGGGASNQPSRNTYAAPVLPQSFQRSDEAAAGACT